MPLKKRVWRKKPAAVPVRRRQVRKTGMRRSKLVTKSQLYRAIRRNVETKFATNQYTYSQFNSGINSAGDLITVLPQIQNGTGQNGRIGHSIRPLRLVIKGYVCYHTDALVASAAYLSASMLGARLFLFQDKTNRSYTNGITNYQILDAGGTSANFTGTAMQWVLPHNNDQFKFFVDRRMKILKPFGYTNSTAPTNATDITSFNNTMFHPFTITLKQKQLPAVIQYDDTLSNSYPTNFSPFLALGYCDLLNKTADVINSRLGMEFSATLYYEDA